LNETIKLEFNGFRFRINGLPEDHIINYKEEFAQMSGWGYKKGFSETNFNFAIFRIKPNNECIIKDKYFVYTSKAKQTACDMSFVF
jgi:hypothetical protein